MNAIEKSEEDEKNEGEKIDNDNFLLKPAPSSHPIYTSNLAFVQGLGGRRDSHRTPKA